MRKQKCVKRNKNRNGINQHAYKNLSLFFFHFSNETNLRFPKFLNDTGSWEREMKLKFSTMMT